MSESTQAPDLLRGHTASVLCCTVHHSHAILASGSEDGDVAIHDFRSHELAQRINLGESGPVEVPSAIFGVEDQQVFACAEACVFQIDMRQGAVLQRYTVNNDEINSLALSPNGTYLAAADDTGAIKIINVRTHQLHKTLTGCHSNICAAVSFRPHHPWELLSGGLDAQVVRWNFATGRPVRRWQMGVELVQSDSTQAFNPPLAHNIDVASPPWAPRQFGRLVAVARGDGHVALYDADHVDPGPKKGKKVKGKKGSGGASGCQDSATAEDTGRLREGQICCLTQQDGGHSASVGTVAFHQASNGRHVVSGGNDAALLIWDWTSCVPDDSPWATTMPEGLEADSSTGYLHRISHGRKVNAVATCRGTGLNTFVADTSRTIKAYSIT
ncbi:WD repeat-containing protein 53 [Coccomyxa sp. Obi]|nr:WD repeat-containing protein 53 [Coccomyxa sp. Obi]